jgi:tRNA threonylcarbamoyladenosine biosynthesis protein TsaE
VVVVRTRAPEETAAAGRKLGASLEAGDTVCLFGELGAGKTVFVKGIAQALGISEREITSASFTIVAEHDSAPPLYHIDLYRLESAADLDSAGVYDYIGGDGVAVIEWAERAEPEAVLDAIKVNINILGEAEREIVIDGLDDKSEKMVKERLEEGRIAPDG